MLNLIRSWGPWLLAMIATLVAFFGLGGKIKP
jgi:hypothetical protein